MSEYNVAIGRRIYDKRREKGISREQMLEYVDISEVYLGMIERGKRGTSIEHMVQIANALGMSMDYLILGKEKEFDKSDSVVRELESLEPEERNLIAKFAGRIKINLLSQDKLNTAFELLQLYVQYEKNRLQKQR